MVLLILPVDERTVFRRCNFQTPPVCLYFSRCGTFADASPRQTEDSKNQDVFPGIGDTPGLPDFDIPGLPGIGDTLPNKDLQSLVPDIPRLLGVPSAKCQEWHWWYWCQVECFCVVFSHSFQCCQRSGLTLRGWHEYSRGAWAAILCRSTLHGGLHRWWLPSGELTFCHGKIHHV